MGIRLGVHEVYIVQISKYIWQPFFAIPVV